MNERVAKWDNIKFVLMFLVVYGHIINPYTGVKMTDYMNGTYLFIWSFHMPAFLFISGMFGKKVIDNKRYDKMATFILLYFFVHIAKTVADIFTVEGPKLKLFATESVPWYAFIMFVYYMITVVTSRYSKVYVMAASIVLSLIASYDYNIGNDILMVHRIITFYPFFYAGYILDQEKVLEFTRKKWVKALGALVFVVLIYMVCRHTDAVYQYRGFLSGRNTYNKLIVRDLLVEGLHIGPAPIHKYAVGCLIKLMYYVVVFILIAALFAIIPERKNVFSSFGGRTLSIYALHYPCIVILFKSLHIDKRIMSIAPEFFKPGLLIIAFVITLICGLPVCHRFVNTCIHPKKIKD